MSSTGETGTMMDTSTVVVDEVATEGEVEQELLDSFDASVEEGIKRLSRSGTNLAATGLMAGLDVGFGVLALLYVQWETGSELLGGLAFTIGFFALHLGRSELFTENFLVPVATVQQRIVRAKKTLAAAKVPLRRTRSAPQRPRP